MTESRPSPQFLDRLRATFRWKTDDLDATGLRTSIGASTLTLAGLLKHLPPSRSTTRARSSAASRSARPESQHGDGDPDWEFTSAGEDRSDELYALWDGAVARSRARFDAALTDGGLDRPIHVSGEGGVHASLRRLVCDLLEEYGRHTSHADLIREAVDGRVGEDPPPGWQASGSRSART